MHVPNSKSKRTKKFVNAEKVKGYIHDKFLKHLKNLLNTLLAWAKKADLDQF